jgi:hypothetical protein
MSNDDVNDAKLESIWQRLDELKTLPVSVEGLRVEVEALKIAISRIQQPGQTQWCLQHMKTMEHFEERIASVERKVWYASGGAAILAFIATHLWKGKP